jgi:predicted HTH domain antitoxin
MEDTRMAVVVEFPERLLLATKSERKLFPRQVMLYTLGHFYQQGKISAGYAAQLLNCDKVTFYRLLSENGFSVIDYDETDLEMEAQPLVAKT